MKTPSKIVVAALIGALLVPAAVVAQNTVKRYRGTHSFDRVNGLIVSIAGTDITSTAAELNINDGVTATATELNYLDITTLGTGAASKAVVLDAGDDYTWPSTGVLTYGGTGITASGAEVNYLDITTLGTGAASKAVVLDAGDDYIWPTSGLLSYGGANITASGTELSYTDVTTIGVAQASKAAILDSNKDLASLRVLTSGHYRVTNGTALTAADVNIAKATLQASNYFPVNTASNAVDVDFADDAALDAADLGAQWIFMVQTGHATQALTVTAGASGVTTVTSLNTLGTTCEDEGDYIQCTARDTTKITCATVCAD